MATIPDKPNTRTEQYLNRLVTNSGEIPEKPLTNIEQYLAALVEGGGGGGGGDGIPKSATFWGANYNETNNNVGGDLVFYAGDRASEKVAVGELVNQNKHILMLDGKDGVSVRIAGQTRFKINNSAIDVGSDIDMKNSYNTPRRILNLGIPSEDGEAANKSYVDALTVSYAALNGSAAPTTVTEGKYVGQLYYDTTNEAMYYLKAIDTTTTPATYTWETLGGGSSSIVDLNYSEYNPTGISNPTLSFGEWLYSKNLQAGTIVRMHNDTGYSGARLFIGHTNDTGTDVFYTLDREPVAFLIYQNMKGMPGVGDQGYFRILSLGTSSNGCFDLWQWSGTSTNPIQYFSVRYIPTSLNIKGTGENYYSSTDILSAESGNAVSLSASAATNIAGLSKVNVEPLGLVLPKYKGTFTFNQTMEPWDWEWRGTAELDSGTPFNFSTAEVGSILAVYIRDTNGVPLNYLNPYEESYELTDTSGNTITVPGTLKDSGTAKIRIGHLILLRKYDDGWYFTNDGYDATYLQRTIESGVGDLSTLTTTDKTSAVAAINELNAKLGDIETALNTLNNGGGAESEPDSEADTVPVAPMVPPLD